MENWGITETTTPEELTNQQEALECNNGIADTIKCVLAFAVTVGVTYCVVKKGAKVVSGYLERRREARLLKEAELKKEDKLEA